MSIKEKDRVIVTGGIYDGKVGVVMTTVEAIDTAIVDFDFTIGKVPLSSLAVFKSADAIPEGAKRISKGDFMSALHKITSPEAIFDNASDNPRFAFINGMATIAFGRQWSTSLFGDADAVVMTENELIGSLWDICDPVKTAEIAGKNHTGREYIPIVCGMVLNLHKIVEILFAESEAETEGGKE